tara:strand:+ start:2350 stop:2559 length:210 start_codon:yes stop_codon:yes gene_type:complete
MSTKNSFITGKDFYIFTEIFEEDKGVFIKFFQPKEVKLSTHNSGVSEVEVCISKETWIELQNKIKHFKE